MPFFPLNFRQNLHPWIQALQEGILVSMKRYGMNTDISRAVDMLQSQVCILTGNPYVD